MEVYARGIYSQQGHPKYEGHPSCPLKQAGIYCVLGSSDIGRCWKWIITLVTTAKAAIYTAQEKAEVPIFFTKTTAPIENSK